MNTKTLMIAALTAFVLAAVPSAAAEPSTMLAPDTADDPNTIPCILHVSDVNVAGVITIREVVIGSCT